MLLVLNGNVEAHLEALAIAAFGSPDVGAGRALFNSLSQIVEPSRDLSPKRPVFGPRPYSDSEILDATLPPIGAIREARTRASVMADSLGFVEPAPEPFEFRVGDVVTIRTPTDREEVPGWTRDMDRLVGIPREIVAFVSGFPVIKGDDGKSDWCFNQSWLTLVSRPSPAPEPSKPAAPPFPPLVGGATPEEVPAVLAELESKARRLEGPVRRSGPGPWIVNAAGEVVDTRGGYCGMKVGGSSWRSALAAVLARRAVEPVAVKVAQVGDSRPIPPVLFNGPMGDEHDGEDFDGELDPRPLPVGLPKPPPNPTGPDPVRPDQEELADDDDGRQPLDDYGDDG